MRILKLKSSETKLKDLTEISQLSTYDFVNNDLVRVGLHGGGGRYMDAVQVKALVGNLKDKIRELGSYVQDYKEEVNWLKNKYQD